MKYSSDLSFDKDTNIFHCSTYLMIFSLYLSNSWMRASLCLCSKLYLIFCHSYFSLSRLSEKNMKTIIFQLNCSKMLAVCLLTWSCAYSFFNINIQLLHQLLHCYLHLINNIHEVLVLAVKPILKLLVKLRCISLHSVHMLTDVRE